MPTANKHTILLIDSDADNLKSIQADLTKQRYHFLEAANEKEGWKLLQKHKKKVMSIIINHHKPYEKSIQFAHKLSTSKELKHIPVILQISAARKKQLEEGIKSGVYYFLTKPYEIETMRSLVRTAIHDYVEYVYLRAEIKRFRRKLYLVKESYFEIKTLEDARYLTTFLANFYPEPRKVIFGISELLINAIEHGNLEIGYEQKTLLNQQNRWEKEIKYRQRLQKNKNKKALVHFVRNPHAIVLSIKDDGKGFNWKRYMEVTPERAMDNHGRGIALARMGSFDAVHYNKSGNQVTCTVHV